MIARTGLPRAAFGQLLMHARVDDMHAAQLHQILDSLPLTPAQERLLGPGALTTLRLVAEALLESLDGVAVQPPDRFAPPLRRRVRKRNATLVTIPSSQPSTALATMIHTSEACPEPTTQLSFTWRVLAIASAIRTTRTQQR